MLILSAIQSAWAGGVFNVAPPENSLEFDGSTDYLSMSDANFGSYDRAQFAIAGAFRADAGSGAIFTKRSTGAREFFMRYDGSADQIDFETYSGSGGGATDGRYSSATGNLTTANWYAFLLHFDRNNATTGDRIRLWINGTEDTPAIYIAPSSTIPTTTSDVRIGYDPVDSIYFDGLIYQPTFFSGSLPDPADVFDGTAGKLKNLSGLAGAHSSLDASTATNDVILSTDWTNNGTVTTSSTIP